MTAAPVIRTYALNSVWPQSGAGTSRSPPSWLSPRWCAKRSGSRDRGSGWSTTHPAPRDSTPPSSCSSRPPPYPSPYSGCTSRSPLKVLGLLQYWCRIAYPLTFRYRISHLLHGRGSGPWVLYRKFRPENPVKDPGSFTGSSAREKRQQLKNFREHKWKKQCCGSGSEWFWESWILIRFVLSSEKVVRRTLIPTVL